MNRLPRVSFILPGIAVSGGVRVTLEMCRELRCRGHQARVLVPAPQGLAPRLRSRLLRAVAPEWLRQGQAVCQFVAGPIHDLAFDDDEVCVGVGTGGALLLQQVPGGVRKLRYCHGFSEHLPEQSLQAWSGGIPTIAVSGFLLGGLRDLGATDVRGVVPNGIRADEFFIEQSDASPSRVGIGTIYNSNPKKAPGDVLAVLATISERRPEIPLHMYGANRRPSCPKGVKYLRSPSVGHTRSLYNRSRVWFIASRSEGFCLPILEAMACGVAVVSTDHDTARGLVEPGVTGELVPVGDVEGLVSQAVELWDDEGRRVEMAQAARENVQRFDWPSAAESLESVVREL